MMRIGLSGWALALVGCPAGEIVDRPLPELFSDCDGSTGDPIAIEGLDGATEPFVEMSGDTLRVAVGHGGGCEAHEYVLCWPTQDVSASDPPVVALSLFHDANGDMCEAYLSEVLEFDLSPLRTEHGLSGAHTVEVQATSTTASVDHTF